MQSDSNAAKMAKQIVMDVRQRRKAGEVLPDEQVLEQYPALRAPLLEQLRQLRQLEQASANADSDSRLADRTGHAAFATDLSEKRDKYAELRRTQRETRDRDLRSTIVVQHDPDDSLGPTNVATPAQPGKVVDQTAPYRPVVRAPMAIVKLYHDGVRSFNYYPVMSDRYLIGRLEGDLTVPHDVRMSSRHAEIQRQVDGETYRWFLVDLDSTNGTFVRADRVTLKNDDELMIGKECYRFVCRNGAAGLTYVRGVREEQWWFDSNMVWIGREAPCGLSVFSRDEFLDSKHAFVQLNAAGEWIIKDASSLNGIWYRVQQVEMTKSCAFQLGEQRFGFYCPLGKAV